MGSNRNWLRAALAGGIAALMAGPALAADISLKAGTFFPPVDPTWYPPIQQFLDRINENGKAVGLDIKMVAAGGKGVSPFEMGNAVKTGVLDVVHLGGNYYARILPVADAHKLSTLTVQEQRKNGAFDFLRPLYAQYMNTYFLGKWGDGEPFHFYLNKKVDKPDFTGLKIRGTTSYQALIERLGGTIVSTPPGEAFTALERGVAEGYGWALWGIGGWGWEKVTKYRVEPGFYLADIQAMVNLDTWKKMSPAQQKVLEDAQIALENDFIKLREVNDAKERAFQEKAGIQVIRFEGADREKFLKAAEDAGWEDVLKKDPVNGPKARELMTKK